MMKYTQKYNAFVQLLKKNFQIVLQDGFYKEKTLRAWAEKRVRANPSTIRGIVEILGKDWEPYVD